MDWLNALKSIAPTVATALGGPLAGAAVTALGGVLGMTKPTTDAIGQIFKDGMLTPDHLAEIRKLELQYQNDEQERGFKYAELVYKDVDSARQRESAVKDNTNRILAYTVVGSFIALVCTTMLGWAHIDSALAGTLVGYLSAKAEQVLAYYFGSSKSVEHATTLLSRADAIKD